ncbi:TIGR02678 family protein [Actinospica sp. MGRD01-02]|uniref:TIGR02678 family protein n=1 Tax=Actinospica acidithermotolerans TaxID=2828514 RepID=A0A941IGJ3_9ACTN|nr:TIGR02678 family protein [Actinospica acidithermotolerans]MBR7824712.1 TIGR02678 family protein [Actinospica acidithermotolerans]
MTDADLAATAGDGAVLAGPRSAALAADVRAERVKAARALLARPLLHVGCEEFRLVRKHAAELTAWFAAETGWRLSVDAQTARLLKTPARLDDASRPAVAPKTKTAFTRRRYVLLCLALAVLERSDSQITLGRLADGVITGMADPAFTEAGIDFRLERREERSDLVAAVRLLLDLEVLERVHGDEEAFVAQAENDVLYDVRRRVLSGLLATTRAPSGVRAGGFEQRLAELTAEPRPDTDESRLRALRHRLTRRLLDDPVVYYAELDEDERDYLVRQRQAITARINALTGLVPELRAEGVAMVDPDDELTDVRMPEQGTEGHVTLLIAAHLAEQGGAASRFELARLVRALAAEHGKYWRKSATDPAAAGDLVDAALRRLLALDLIEVSGEAGDELFAAKPAIHRYALAAPRVTVPGAKTARKDRSR